MNLRCRIKYTLKRVLKQRHEVQRQKLAGMLDELQDSETKLQAMAEKLENVEQQLEQCNQQVITSSEVCA